MPSEQKSGNNSGKTKKAIPLPYLRKQAREFAMQGMYQWQLADTGLKDIEVQFRVENPGKSKKTDWSYFQDLMQGVTKNLTDIDEKIEPLLDRKLKELNYVELAILRLGVYELVHRMDVPYKVVINEGVELAKKYGATDSHKYINGILDKAAQDLRVVEMNKGKKGGV